MRLFPKICPRRSWKCRPSESDGKTYHDRINQLKKKMIMDAVKQTQGKLHRSGEIRSASIPTICIRLIRNLDIKGEIRGDIE